MNRKTALDNFIKNEVIRNPNANIDENEDLIGAGILDSLGILQVVAFIDESFGIQVPDEEVVYENFHSLGAIINFLQQYP